MKKHICKQCGNIFEYCRGCLLSPILYKDEGYCSKTCFEESKKPKVEEIIPVEDVEVVVIDEDISTSEEEVVASSFFFVTEESQVNIAPTNQYYANKKKKNKKNYKENVNNDNK